MIKSVEIKIFGKVQNVGFRYFTQKAAERLGISGFVKNEYDGSVYVEAEGDELSVELFVLQCRKGPGWCRVDKVQVQKTPPKSFQGFSRK